MMSAMKNAEAVRRKAPTEYISTCVIYFSSVVAGVIRNEIFLRLFDIRSKVRDVLTAIATGMANINMANRLSVALSMGTPAGVRSSSLMYDDEMYFPVGLFLILSVIEL